MASRLYSILDGCEYTGLSRSQLYLEIKAGRLESVKVGRRRLISETALDMFIHDLERAARTPAPAA